MFWNEDYCGYFWPKKKKIPNVYIYMTNLVDIGCYLLYNFLVVNEIRGEIAIFDTGREKGETSKHGKYRILNRVVNDPYDMLGCWCSDR